MFFYLFSKMIGKDSRNVVFINNQHRKLGYQLYKLYA